MNKYSTYVGLDVHKNGIAAARAGAGDSKVEFVCELGTDTQSVDKLLRRFVKGETLFCYEAGPCGYGLYRHIVSRGYNCEVIAPSLVPKKAGERVKTDRRDAKKLAGYSRAGELTAVWVPDAEQESIRDLTRAREDAKGAEKRAKLNLKSFLLRHGKIGEHGAWSKAYFDWLSKLTFPYAHQQIVFQDYVDAVKRNGERTLFLEKQMRTVCESWKLKLLCDKLMMLRGVSLITAMTILAEFGDLLRFRTARELMGYIGIVPSESTSGDSVRRGRITKTGNTHVRRLLVESAWCSRLLPRKTKEWNRQAKEVPPAVQEIAWKAMVRLHQRYWRLSNRKMRSQKVVVAVARELAGFIWAIAQEHARTPLPVKKAA